MGEEPEKRKRGRPKKSMEEKIKQLSLSKNNVVGGIGGQNLGLDGGKCLEKLGKIGLTMEDKVLRLKITPLLWAQIEDYARQSGIEETDIVRRAIEHYLGCVAATGEYQARFSAAEFTAGRLERLKRLEGHEGEGHEEHGKGMARVGQGEGTADLVRHRQAVEQQKAYDAGESHLDGEDV